MYLIGDSIRCGSVKSPGYECFVREKLKGSCNVYSPDENCRFAQYTLRGLCDWVKVNDLYSAAKQFDESYYADWTHFNEKGAIILADEIIKNYKNYRKGVNL